MRANWFELPVNDMDRAKEFYVNIFDIQMADNMEIGNSIMSFFPFETDQSGATGTLIKQESYIPSHEGTMVYFSVTEINDVLPRITSAGGKVLNEKMSIGEHGFVAHFEDSEGNRVALHQQVS
ncbi:VOC family protein [Ekhidna sp. To15]|uniref:VOC family protein n=1 Tax=Ekhidna sp. To15 TaxID=3395267 RepID=UPI003F521834